MAALPYVKCYQKVKESIDVHENDTTTTYISQRSDNKYLFSGEAFPRDQTFNGKKVFWSKSWPDGTSIDYDGIPFFIVGHEIFECHNGAQHKKKS